MRVVTTIAEARAELDEARSQGRSVGFVPTMGYLHEGHRSLLVRSGTERDLTFATIFVNPLQFGADEDLTSYPRDLARDTALTEEAGVALLLVPPLEEMYPEPVLTTVTVAGVSAALEGEARPTHFSGVATVVAKLFAIAGPCRAYFGEKDFQQLAVIRRMASDLSLPVEVVGCPTVREPDGLALSSRNAYLTAEERAAAPVVHRALQAGRAVVLEGERSSAAVVKVMHDVIATEPAASIDYAAVVDAATFDVPDPLVGTLRLLAAVRFGRARLIDNIGLGADL
jgi:pantoate--beta-alanine ligase